MVEDRAAQDRTVVRQTLDGNDAAFAELVRRHQKMVTAVAWRYGVPRNEIEDVVSEVFFKVYRNLHQYQPRHPFGTWLYRLAANHVVDHGRRKRRERGRTEMPEHLEAPGPDPGDGAEQQEQAGLVRACMNDLRPHYREVLFLVYVEGMRVEDAARALGLPIGTIKSRLKRGRDSLRKILVRRHPEHFGD